MFKFVPAVQAASVLLFALSLLSSVSFVSAAATDLSLTTDLPATPALNVVSRSSSTGWYSFPLTVTFTPDQTGQPELIVSQLLTTWPTRVYAGVGVYNLSSELSSDLSSGKAHKLGDGTITIVMTVNFVRAVSPQVQMIVSTALTPNLEVNPIIVREYKMADFKAAVDGEEQEEKETAKPTVMPM